MCSDTQIGYFPACIQHGQECATEHQCKQRRQYLQIAFGRVRQKRDVIFEAVSKLRHNRDISRIRLLHHRDEELNETWSQTQLGQLHTSMMNLGFDEACRTVNNLNTTRVRLVDSSYLGKGWQNASECSPVWFHKELSSASP